MPTHINILQIDDSSDKTIVGTITYDRTNGGILIAPAGTSFPTTPSAGEIFWRTDQDILYRRNDANSAWEAIGAAPTGIAGGDLDGYYPNPDVIDLTIAGEVQGSVLYFDGFNWVQLPPSTAGLSLLTQGGGSDPIWGAPAPGGAAGGDLGGTYPNPTVVDLTITGEVQGSILYFDGSNWVQLSPGTDGYFLQTQGAGDIPQWAPLDSGPPFADIAEATADTTTTSTTDVLVAGMTLTPPAGTYKVSFTSAVEVTAFGATTFPSIYVDGVQEASSEREIQRTGLFGGVISQGFACEAEVIVNGSQAIEGRIRTTAGTATIHERTLIIVEVE